MRDGRFVCLAKGPYRISTTSRDSNPAAKSKLREARDRLSASDSFVGVFYFKIRWYPGAVDRLNTLLKRDPEYSGRDGVYFYLGESLVKLKREAEPLPYFEKLTAEFSRASIFWTPGSGSTS